MEIIKLNEENNYKKESTTNFMENIYYKQDIIEIKEMINDVGKNLKKMIEKSNEEYINLMYNNLKNEFISSINGHMLHKIDGELEQRMINNCDMKEQCKTLFEKYLKKHTDNLNPDTTSEEKILKSRNELNDLRKIKKKDDCDTCFDEVSNIFENQVALIKSLKLYDNQDEEDEKKITDIDEKQIVKSILEPISHEKRLKILKTIALEPQSFSKLSKLTNLKGGNLIFHINKLEKNDLIFQKQNHGEYILTTKGFKLIELILKMEN